MGTPYPLEKKNQILGRILSKEITVEQAHREYSIATSCVYRWLRQLKADSRSGGQGTQAIPLPQGMNFRAVLVAEGYCQKVGFESPAAGKFCCTKGVTLDEIKRFSTWLAQHDDDVVLSASARAREQERINKVTALSEEQKQQNRVRIRVSIVKYVTASRMGYSGEKEAPRTNAKVYQDIFAKIQESLFLKRNL